NLSFQRRMIVFVRKRLQLTTQQFLLRRIIEDHIAPHRVPVPVLLRNSLLEQMVQRMKGRDEIHFEMCIAWYVSHNTRNQQVVLSFKLQSLSNCRGRSKIPTRRAFCKHYFTRTIEGSLFVALDKAETKYIKEGGVGKKEMRLIKCLLIVR